MDRLQLDLGASKSDFRPVLDDLTKNKVISRIWQKDHTVWQDDPEEITNRLGWLTIMDDMQEQVIRINTLVNAVQADGYTNVIVVGMGGSSLAPEVFSYIFDDDGGLDLDILDSTDPDEIRAFDTTLNLEKTLFIISTKSGGTAETLSGFKYFYNRLLEINNGDKTATGQHFVGITDPGSKLIDLSETYQFRDLFLNDPNIGGRYSVLSYFGLVPAAFVDVNIEELLNRAQTMADASQADNNSNPASQLGAIMGGLAKAGRDKVTIFASPQLANFGDWVEQLIAESTGKDGKGILPVVGEAIGTPENYSDDRLFVYLKVDDDTSYDTALQQLQEAGQPVITLHLVDVYDIGGQFFLWEMATAIAGHILNIHPFNQPNVESAKNQARAKIDEYKSTGKLEELPVALESDGIAVIGEVDADSAPEALKAFLAQAEDSAYISIHAYLQPNAVTSEALSQLQTRLRDTTQLATTVGYGPRFLHSTGQLHKGDAGNGLFIQFVTDKANDVDIPDQAGSDDSSMTFGTLIEAQALGDRAALLEVERKVIRFRLSDVQANLATLTDSL